MKTRGVWSNEANMAFESTLKAWAAKNQFKLDAEGWPRISNWEALKASGSVRSEGRDYVVEDGDVLLFHHQ